ncbi:hypothetical protein CU633_09430 [Bacillus sp. V3-13]|uniref:hypothetical protein n=1 Tax=Bacillus sp. V3-13 TaxID=2053728 RepID=UPI000C791811|nr:hypothetical protein [Bacillus sp. V3-13]PLR77619.1 hypothetical protein CU633_09430 [Bacillus sp. V3-13]
MGPANIIQSLLRQETLSTHKSTSFKPGQIFQGKVIKLFPNQTAEVLIGTQKVIAQLEAPLSANERYWFQVQPGEGKVHLRVLLPGPDSGGRTPATLEGILSSLSLPATKENIEIVRFFLREQLPITKEALNNASQWIKDSKNFHDGLEALKQMIVKELPFVRGVFTALTSIQKHEPLHTSLNRLAAALENTEPTQASQQLKAILAQLVTNVKEKTAAAGLELVGKEWLHAKNDSPPAFKILQAVGIFPAEATEQEVIETGLAAFANKAAPAGQSAFLQRTIAVVSDLYRNLLANDQQGIKEAVAQLEKLAASVKKPLDTSSQPVRLQNLVYGHLSPGQQNLKNHASLIRNILDAFIQTTEQPGAVKAADILAVFSGAKNMRTGGQQLAGLLGTDINKLSLPFSLQEKNLIEQITAAIVRNSPNWEEGDKIARQLKDLIRTIGFGHEYELTEWLKNPHPHGREKIESLKPLLLQFLNEHPPAPVKEAAEHVLNRITGLQVLAQEAGPLQQFVVQVPVSFWDRTADLTMQWSGRNNEDGSIDPNFCRVLFYLQLENLDETIVDMQVQNRVLNLTIINGTSDIKELTQPFIKPLKTKLQELDYQLSSIQFEQPGKKDGPQFMRKSGPVFDPQQYKGVDVRI